MAKAKAVEKPERQPIMEFDIPVALMDSNLGMGQNRTCHPWVMDRVLGYFGVHSVDIIDSIAQTPDGCYAEIVQAGDKLQLFGKL